MARKEKKYHFIYKTTNLLNGKYYLGMHSTSNLDDGYMGSGKRLRYSINKHGIDNHKVEILEFFETRELLVKREEEIVNLNEIAKVDCMNLKVGGSGGFTIDIQILGGKAASKIIHDRFKNDEGYRKKMTIIRSETMTKTLNDGKIKRCDWNGKKHSDLAKENISKAKIGKNMGENSSQYGTCWITKDGSNKKIKKEEIETYLTEGWVKGRK